MPELFDSILTQHKHILNFFHLEDAGTVLVRGAREKGAVGIEDLDRTIEYGRSMGE